MIGTLKMISSKGFGFIQSNHIDFFFHATRYDNDWAELTKLYINAKEAGEEVEMEFENDPEAPEGPRAKSVKIREKKNGNGAGT